MSLMIKDKTGEIVKVAGNSGGGASDADKIKYDNVTSGLEATNVQSAVDELAEKKADKTEISNVVKAPQTAKVGQILAVKTVGEDGKPSEWECVDAPSGIDISMLPYSQIANIVRMGKAEQYFKIGDQIITTYTDTDGNKYVMPWDVVAFRTVELENGSKVPGMIIQSHYATVESIDFDAPESNSSDQAASIWGWNRWSYSGIRQWLNSSANKGSWWTSTHDGDVAPSQLSSVNGFMKGLPADFIGMLNKTKHETALNYKYPSGSETTYVYDTTYDTFFLPSLKEEHYQYSQYPNYWDGSDKEGSTWEYWIQRKGETAQDYDLANTNAIRYSLADKTTAKVVCLRSANRHTSYYNFIVIVNGGLSYIGSASTSRWCAPACVIC